VTKINETREEEKTRLGILKSQRDSLKKEIDKLREELTELRTKMDPARIQEMEIQREELGNELIGSRKIVGTTETNLATLESKFGNVLKIMRLKKHIKRKNFSKLNLKN
jgi:phage shock protein A